MASKWCMQCCRPVGTVSSNGAGDVVLFFLTGGLWALVMLFRKRRCAVCGATWSLKKM
jgi:hypothetical protein